MICLPSKLLILLLVAAAFIFNIITATATVAQQKSYNHHNKTTLTVGYLTSMKEGPSDRQGLAISGAFTMALDEVIIQFK